MTLATRLAAAATAAAALLLVGPATARADEPHQITVDGRERVYELHVPAGYDGSRPVPLVVALHGGGGDIAKARAGYRLEPIADREGFIVAYPQGIDGHWNDGRGVRRIRSHREEVDDVAFIGAMIDEVAASHRVDPRRIYATGASNGAMMSMRLALQTEGRFAAVATLIGNLPQKLATATPKEPIPILMINGTADPLVPFEGGFVRVLRRLHGLVLSVDDTVAYFVTHNRAAATATTTDLPDEDPADGTTATRTVHDGAAPVELLTVKGGGHTLPGGAQYLPEALIGKTSRDFDSAETIWAFLSRHARAEPPGSVPH